MRASSYCHASKVVGASRVTEGHFPQRLHKVASSREYFPTKKANLPLMHHRLFKLTQLHKFETTDEYLDKNKRGFTTGSTITAALAPSLTHFLFHRGGICFEESAEMVKQRRIEVDGTVVESQEQLESQAFWFDIAERDIRIRPEGQLQNSGETTRTSVPVAHRALHRTYLLTYVNPTRQNITTEVADPKSMIHKIARFVSPTDLIGMNIVRPIGFISGMGGLAILSNDVLTLRHWNNEHVGNFGVYELRFHRGAPREEIASVQSVIQRALKSVLQQQHRDMRQQGGYGCWQHDSPPSTIEVDPLAPHVPLSLLQQLHPTRLMVKTPLFPFHAFRAIRRRIRLCSLVQMGPFVLPPSLGRDECRPLNLDELTAFFAYERKLKTNRLVFTLREFDDDDDDDDEGDDDAAAAPVGGADEE